MVTQDVQTLLKATSRQSNTTYRRALRVGVVGIFSGIVVFNTLFLAMAKTLGLAGALVALTGVQWLESRRITKLVRSLAALGIEVPDKAVSDTLWTGVVSILCALRLSRRLCVRMLLSNFPRHPSLRRHATQNGTSLPWEGRALSTLLSCTASNTSSPKGLFRTQS